MSILQMLIKDYFMDFWINRVGPQTLSVFNKRHRTNNFAENFYKYLKQYFRVAHPNVWTFLGK